MSKKYLNITIFFTLKSKSWFIDFNESIEVRDHSQVVDAWHFPPKQFHFLRSKTYDCLWASEAFSINLFASKPIISQKITHDNELTFFFYGKIDSWLRVFIQGAMGWAGGLSLARARGRRGAALGHAASHACRRPPPQPRARPYCPVTAVRAGYCCVRTSWPRCRTIISIKICLLICCFSCDFCIYFRAVFICPQVRCSWRFQVTVTVIVTNSDNYCRIYYPFFSFQ